MKVIPFRKKIKVLNIWQYDRIAKLETGSSKAKIIEFKRAANG
mgnify:CR=1 FL=1